MLFDSHIHVGPFCDHYFSPSNVAYLMSSVGVDYYAVSSTSICEENYEKAVDEIHQLVNIEVRKTIPVMWISPYGLNGSIAWYLESDIKWKMIKIHPELHPDAWHPDGQNMKEVIGIARELKIPLLIHTGNLECCHAGIYDNMIAENPDVNFVLAHGRPTIEALEIVTKHKNAYADSAFMPISEMNLFCSANFSDKLLWGTDMCIPKHFYPNVDMAEYYKRKLATFQSVCKLPDFENVTFNNAIKLFGIEVS